MTPAYADSTAIVYDAQAAPMIGTVTYDVSVSGAERGVSDTLASGGEQTVIGFSQGSDGAVRGALDARRQGLLDEDNTKLLLIGNPSNPGAPGSGVRGIAYSLPLLPGFESVKPHEDLGATEQVEICLQYDPTCRYSANDPVNMALGYIAHTGQGPFTNYNTVDPESAVVQHDGAVTHVTYMTPAPVDELRASLEPQPPVVNASLPYQEPAPVTYEQTPFIAPTVVHDAAVAAVEFAPQFTPQITQITHQAESFVTAANAQVAGLQSLLPRSP